MDARLKVASLTAIAAALACGGKTSGQSTDDAGAGSAQSAGEAGDAAGSGSTGQADGGSSDAEAGVSCTAARAWGSSCGGDSFGTDYTEMCSDGKSYCVLVEVSGTDAGPRCDCACRCGASSPIPIPCSKTSDAAACFAACGYPQ